MDLPVIHLVMKKYITYRKLYINKYFIEILSENILA
jgi:hypothetical protein